MDTRRCNSNEAAGSMKTEENQMELNLHLVHQENTAVLNNMTSNSKSTNAARYKEGARMGLNRPTKRVRRNSPKEIPQKSSLEVVKLQSSHRKVASSSIIEVQDIKRAAKQNATAKDLATQQERNRIAQLLEACNQAEAKVRAEKAKYLEKIKAADELLQRLAQTAVAIKAGQIREEEIPVEMKALLKSKEACHRPHTTAEIRDLIRELANEMPQRQIAAKVGVAQSTVSYVLHHDEHREKHAGRPPKLTPLIVAAAARYRFLFHQQNFSETAKWIEEEFGVKVSKNTIQRHMKALGFRMGDFKRYPRDRNSDKAVVERYKFATTMPCRYGETTLCDAIYAGEIGLVMVTSPRMYSIKGWYPLTDDDVALNHNAHITVQMVLSPRIGVVWFEIREGIAKGEDLLKVYQNAVEAIVSKTPFSGFNEYDALKKRAFVVDDVGNRHDSKIFTTYFNGETVRNLFGFHYLPAYSPFLNPVEEVNAIIRYRTFRKMAESELHTLSKAAVKEIVIQVISELTTEEIMKCFSHTNDFLNIAKEQGHVYSQQRYEKTHLEAEFANNSEIMGEVDQVIAKYIPDDYSIYTPGYNSQLLQSFNKKQIDTKTPENTV